MADDADPPASLGDPTNELPTDHARRVAYEQAANRRLSTLATAIRAMFGDDVNVSIIAWKDGNPVPIVISSNLPAEAALEYARAIDLEVVRNGNSYVGGGGAAFRRVGEPE